MQRTPSDPMTTRMSSKGQIVIPRKACEALGVHAGTEFVINVEKDSYRLVPKRKTMEEFFNRLDAMERPVLKKPLSLKEMDAMIADHVVEMDNRTKSKAAQKAKRKK